MVNKTNNNSVKTLHKTSTLIQWIHDGFNEI